MDENKTLVGRPHWSERFAFGVLGPLFLVAGSAALVKGEPLGIVIVLGALYALSDLWRKVTVTATEIRAQGRVARRSIPLAEVAEIGMSPMCRIWLHSDTRPGFYLRMVSHGGFGPHGVYHFFDELGERVRANGGVADNQRRPHPPGTDLWFSA